MGGENDDVHAGRIEEVVLESWSNGAVLLIGDAAHATSPNMAQGAAMALEDAIVLAQSFTAAAGIAAGLTEFERRRTLPPAIRGLMLRRFGKRILHSNYRPLREQP